MDLLSKVLVALVKIFLGDTLSPEENALVKEHKNKRAGIIGNKTALKAALKAFNIDIEIRKAVMDAYYDKRANKKLDIYKLFKEKLFGTGYVVKTYHIVPIDGNKSLSTINSIKGFKSTTTSLLVEYFAKTLGFNNKVKSANLGNKIVKDANGNYKSSDGFIAELGTGRYTFPLKNVIFVEFGLLIKEFGSDARSVVSRWKELMQFGVIEFGGRLYSAKTQSRLLQNKGAKLYVFVHSSSSGQKAGSMMMAHFGNNLEASHNKAMEIRNSLDGGIMDVISAGFNPKKASKYAKRLFSVAGASGLKLGDIDLSKNAVLIKKTAWIDKNVSSNNVPKEILDGQSMFRASFLARLLSNLLGILVEEFDAVKCNLQLRVGVFAGKTFSISKTDFFFDRVVRKALNDGDYDIIGNIYDEKGNLDVSKVVLISDTNVFKLYNEFKTSGISIDKLTLVAMNIAHKSKFRANLSAQTSNKFGKEMREGYDNYVCSALEAYVREEVRSYKEIEPGAPVKVSSRVADAAKSVLGGACIGLSVVQTEIAKTATSLLNSIVEKGAVKVPGATLAVSMEEAPIVLGLDNLLKADESRYECFSTDILDNVKEAFKDFADGTTCAIESFLEFVMLKYPSQGTDEWHIGNFVTLEEMFVRIAVLVDRKVTAGEITVGEAADLAYDLAINVKYHGGGSVLMCNSPVSAILLAGFDKDFDKLVFITSKGFVELAKKKEELKNAGLDVVVEDAVGIVNDTERDTSQSVF